MITNMKIALAAALVLGAGSLAQASENNGGNETGGYVLPPGMDGVNPVYHPRWFPQYGRAETAIYSQEGAAYGFVPPAPHHKHPSGR
jgi:hypothetical protein